MFSLFEGASLKIAKNLIQVTGVQEALTLFCQKKLPHMPPEEAMELILALNACNLMQTMREDFIDHEIGPEDRQDIVEDFVVENIRRSSLFKAGDGAERMEKCLAIMEISERLRAHWLGEEDHTGPGPRYYAVKDILRRLNSEENHDLHDALFEFVQSQCEHFIQYFKDLLDKPGAPDPSDGSGIPSTGLSKSP